MYFCSNGLRIRNCRHKQRRCRDSVRSIVFRLLFALISPLHAPIAHVDIWKRASVPVTWYTLHTGHMDNLLLSNPSSFYCLRILVQLDSLDAFYFHFGRVLIQAVRIDSSRAPALFSQGLYTSTFWDQNCLMKSRITISAHAEFGWRPHGIFCLTFVSSPRAGGTLITPPLIRSMTLVLTRSNNQSSTTPHTKRHRFLQGKAAWGSSCSRARRVRSFAPH